MKKIIITLLVVLFPINIKALSAESYIVMDMDSNRVLESKNIDKKSLIASTTKILTAITALEYGNIEDTVTIDENILSAYGSGIYIQVGEELTLDDLLYGLLLRSGNDASLAIASHVAGSIESFVYLMNEIANRIGMKDSNFLNPSGLEENDNTGNTSTVYDMALLTKYAMQNENYKRYVSTKEITIKSSLKTYKWTNKNKLIHSYKYCTGGKTGFTKKARRTLVTTASKNNINLIVVTFNDGNDFEDHKTLYEKYFNSYQSVKLIDKDTIYDEVYIVKQDYYLLKTKDDKIDLKVHKDNLKDKKSGSVVGKIEIILNDEIIDTINLYYQPKSITENKSFINKLLSILKFWR